jgi:hypothetical protein
VSCEVYCVGGTYNLLPEDDHIYKNPGEVWDLTGATVTLTFTRVEVAEGEDELLNGTSFDRTATIDDAASGLVHYATTTTDLDVPGIWSVVWKVVQGPISLPLEPIVFEVIVCG